MLYQLRDDTSRYKSEADLSKPTTSSKQQQAVALVTTTLSEHKQMGLDTVAISITTEEESTPVGVIIEQMMVRTAIKSVWTLRQHQVLQLRKAGKLV